MKINKYPDGTSYITDVEDKPTVFRINTYEDLWHLNQYVDAYNSKWGKPPVVTIPNLLDAQADRRFEHGQSFGLRLVLDFLHNMNVAKFRIFHPHNPSAIEFGLGDKAEIIDNSDFIQEVLDRLGVYSKVRDGKRMDQHTILMSADAGGYKPLMALCDKIGWQGETFSASKARSWDGYGKESTFSQVIDREDFGGKDIIIVDDLSIYGGTFKGLSKLLEGRNVGKKYLAVSHMTVQNLGDDPVTNYFDRVFTTNSKYEYYYGAIAPGHERTVRPKNLTVIDEWQIT